MFHLGCHLSISKGFSAAANEAIAIGGNTFQFFTRNPRGGPVKALDPNDVRKLESIMEEYQFGPLLAHAPYTLNMASANEDVYEFAKTIFADDLARLALTPCKLYNFHPGSHTGLGVEVGIEKIVNLLNETLTGEEPFKILLEGMSGKGSEIGHTFEQLRDIIEGVRHGEVMGVCLDTCHLYSAGYDIVGNLEGVLNQFDSIVGLNRLKAIHLNDSMVAYDSRKDRHEKIGLGTIGMEAILNIINHPKLRHLPFFLETPNELEGYRDEIAKLRGCYR